MIDGKVKTELENLQEGDLVYFGYRVEPYFASNIILFGMLSRPALKKIFDWETAVRWLQINNYFFQYKKDLEAMEKELRTSLQVKGIHYVNSVVKQCLDYGDTLLSASRELAVGASEIESNEELTVRLEKYFTAMTRYTAFYSLALFERPMMELAEGFAKKNSENPEQEQNLFQLITTSSRETVVEYEQEDFLRLAANTSDNKTDLAKAHAKKYGWLSVRFFVGTPWTADSVLSRLKNIDSKSAQTELDGRLTERRVRETGIEEAIKQFSQEDKEIVGQIREIVFLRNQRADYYNESAYHVRPLLEKIALVLNITYLQLMNLCTAEILLALRGQLLSYKELTTDRERILLIYHSADGSQVFSGAEAEKYLVLKPFLLPKQESVQEIIGKIGYKGKVSGPARIVRTESDISKVQIGDILVTPMTIPNFMPAMEKAIAFVTDEGGITCHAAIISREMHKPCIIGTKIATNVLKDGDMVEVDANKGVVRIIS